MNSKATYKDLLAHCPGILQPIPVIPHGTATSVEYDSRKIKEGSIFVAIEGEYFDGHTFIQDAVENGATLILGTQEEGIERFPDRYILVEDARKALAYLAAAYYDFPASKLVMIGVTGTDGKTTTVNLIYNILKQAGFKAGMISTVNAVIGEETIDTGFHVTTPEATMVQELLAKMVEHGLTHVVLETTSHGLAQQRVAACEYDIGVITNVTHEHLDYHKNYENYVRTKARLLTSLAETETKAFGDIRLAVVNKDDQSYQSIMQILQDSQENNLRIVTYSRQGDADIKVLNEEHTPNGLKLRIGYKNKIADINSSLVGEYNVSNILAAVGATGLGLNIEPTLISKGINTLKGIPGRMERIDMGQNFSAIVDFAHTPNAINVTLETARKMTQKRVVAVFGSAGLRDREKRKIMAAEGVKQADLCIFTAEDPRTEKLEDILNEMKKAAEKAGGVQGKDFYVISDRGKAIRKAVEVAEEDDLVIVCGKGHEQSMCFGQVEYAWDDCTALRAALAELLGIDGPQMPYLPTQEDNKRADL